MSKKEPISASDREASLAVRKDPKLAAYRCKATKDPVHFHVGHTKGSRR